MVLGPDVVCDGFIRSAQVRVQTHVHADHLHEFDSSKGVQQVLASERTHKLLCAIKNADLPYRTNFESAPYGEARPYGDCSVTMLSNDHMLGSTQVAVELSDGIRLGYSGDFSWPLDEVIQVDALVIDSTYGSPASIREYSQADAEEALGGLVLRGLSKGPVNLLAHRGTLQRALNVLAERIDFPVVGSKAQMAEAAIYIEEGYVISPIVDLDSEDGRAILAEGRYVRVFGTGDRRPVDPSAATTIKCSAFLSRGDSPFFALSDRSYSVALSDHADFNGTLAYVKATGASEVVTDNFRGTHGGQLALELRDRLGVSARPSSNDHSAGWGT